MPRLRVSLADRKRVSRACDTCRRRKEKCDGRQPCAHCKSRTKDDACRYSPALQKCKEPIVSDFPTRRVSIGELSQNGSENTLLPDPELAALTSSMNSAPVPKQTSMLRDDRGKFCMP